MNELEKELEYRFGDTLPEPGQALTVAPGVRWARMPLPFVLDHVNVWLLDDQDEAAAPSLTVVDCGIADETIRGHWRTLFDSAFENRRASRVLVTHCHPDHLGLARWLCDGGDDARWQARLWMTLGEYALGAVLSHGSLESNAGGQATAAHLARNGVTEETTLEQVAHRTAYFPTLVPSVPAQFRRLSEGDEIVIGDARWRVITGFGHSPEHCALYCDAKRVLISGDMVLPRISTNVSVFDMEPEGNPLDLYLRSLGRYESLPADTLVLPSHGKPFVGLHTRVRQLRDHHAARLAEVMEACATAPRSAGDIVPLMFRRKLDTHQMTFALGEALAHLHLLWLDGRLRRETGDDGVFRFVPAR
ncbi:MBL fold metallo-hydrolase [Chitinasiproducens palmae]|uniref:Glyoxylase, beta-lactamase superfamily II n=1 Tax=Chitinasiproducens palmae TaxID=1770053 RepID=A0A1H2PNU9_9BURK|nr:MBL fold metallo-hydrolase [Chitinasiproducens palmae]SDV48385.1 Glyoxylase, beta-lactamase superfamily II [Chitinasiproducens palmae]